MRDLYDDTPIGEVEQDMRDDFDALEEARRERADVLDELDSEERTSAIRANAARARRRLQHRR